MRQNLLRNHTPFLVLLAALSLARLYLMTSLELNEDEAYYWEWSRNLALSYYDQGPGVALAMAFGTAILGDTEFGVRLASFLIGIVTLSLGYELAWRMTRSRAGALATALLLAFAPISFINSILMMHDSVMNLGWIGFVYAFCRFLEHRNARWLYGCGAFLGVAMLAKHTAILLVPPVFILVWLRQEERALLRNPHFWGATLLAAAMALPIVYWNAVNDWAGVYAILHLPSSDDHGRPFYQTVGDFLGGQLLVLNPFIALGIAAAVWRTIRAGAADSRRIFLALSTLFMFSFFFVMSFGKMVQANWPFCCYFGGAVLLGTELGRRWEASQRKLAWASLVSTAIMLTPVFFPSTLAVLALGIGVTLPPGAILTNRLDGSAEMAAAMQVIRDAHPEALVCGNRYQETALMAFYLPDQPRTYSLNIAYRPNQYDFWEAPERHAGGDFLFISLTHDELAEEIAACFDSVEAYPPKVAERYGTAAKEYRFFLLRGFRGRGSAQTLR